MDELVSQEVMPRVISFLSSLLQRVAESNDLIRPQKISVFHGLTRPSISIHNYLQRIFKNYNNAYYGKVGGISTAEMNLLEVDFLFGLGFRLNVTPSTFCTYCSYLQREMLHQSPLHSIEPPLTLSKAVALKLHYCFNEDESTTHQQQLAV